MKRVSQGRESALLSAGSPQALQCALKEFREALQNTVQRKGGVDYRASPRAKGKQNAE